MLVSKIDTILKEESFDAEEPELTRTECIETLIQQYGWTEVQQVLFEILCDNIYSKDEYGEVAHVFFGAALDGKSVQVNKAIALLYYRLGQYNEYENELWSITSKLKGLDYLAEYDPMKDEEILRELEDVSC